VLEGKESSKEEQSYIKERLDAARFLIESIYQREKTIKKVMTTILERQQEFFEKGPEHLRPMVLKDVADEIGVHESTVSRATSNKFVLTPKGIFELKFFFDAAIQRTNGDDLAGEAIREKIRKLVASENKKKPLSDEEIVTLLKKEKVDIARRTVAKYRDALGILPSTQRKQLF
jgi:RNA polymerase sigma-54 factor